MNFRTHLSFSFFFNLVMSGFFINGWLNLLLFLFGGILGSMLPDLDHHSGKVNNRLWLFGKILPFLFKHRGFLHSLWFVLCLHLLYMLTVYFLLTPPLIYSFHIGILFGIISHLVADMFTTHGLNVLHPLPFFKVSGFIDTGGFKESVFDYLIKFFSLLLLSHHLGIYVLPHLPSLHLLI